MYSGVMQRTQLIVNNCFCLLLGPGVDMPRTTWARAAPEVEADTADEQVTHQFEP